ncbi:MAG: hypothetical protein QM742_09315 [Aquabacterium sp.]
MLPQLEREFLQADLAQVRALLRDTPRDEDPIEYLQFTQRAQELEARLDALQATVPHAPAALALFFGGKPVVGSHGIKAAFGTKAVHYFQKLVSQRFAADEQGPLSRKGRVPMTEETQLLVTDVVRGSFGFVLQASSESVDAQTSLSDVLDEVTETLSHLASADAALSDEASAAFDNRQLGTLKEFFKLMDDEEASLRLVEGQRDIELDRAAIERARHRVEALSIDDRTEEIAGQLVGWTQFARRFELLRHDGMELVAGEVAKSVMAPAVQEGWNPLNKHFIARCKVREVRTRGRHPRLRYAIVGLDEIPAPQGWEAHRQTGIEG